MMLKRLRTQMVAVTMVSVTIVLALSLTLIYHFTKSSLERESLSILQEIAQQPARLGGVSFGGQETLLPYFRVEIDEEGQLSVRGGGLHDLNDEEFLRQVTDAALARDADSGVLEQYQLRFFVYEEKGALPAGLPQGLPQGLPEDRLDDLWDDPDDSLDDPDDLWDNSYHPDDEGYGLGLAEPGRRATLCIAFADIGQERQTLTDLMRTCLLIGGGSFLIFLLLSILLAHRAVRPVEQAWQQQRQFVGDASHELKTPLTVIMTNAELLQEEGYDSASRRRFTESILSMSRQMRSLVESLLELARVDNGAELEQRQSVDMSQLVEEALLPFEALFFEKGLSLESSLLPGLVVQGSPSRLRQVVDVLLDNAQSYGASGGKALVSLERQGHNCLLTVANSGPPLSQQERQDVFKRFYRADQARGLGRHYGLGLPIAQGIVRSHKGRIWADSREGMNYFMVELPLQ